MSEQISSSQYWAEIEDLADILATEAMQDNDNDVDAAREDIFDSRLHETIDGHEWVIYYAYNDDVLRHSDNDEAYKDCYAPSDIGDIVANQGLESLKTIMSYFAMEADVRERIDAALESVAESLETEETA